jgi:uncharacterized protein (DUF983 family)
MSKLSIYLDYDPNHGIENPDQIHKLPVPQEIKENLADTIKKNLNQEIANDRPKYINMIIIIIGIMFFITCLYSQYLSYYTRLCFVSLTVAVIIIMIYMILSTLPLKERLIPMFIKKVEVRTFGVITIKKNFEYRVKLHSKKKDMSMDEFETLVGFTFNINKKKLKQYIRKNEAKSQELLVQDNENKA